MVRLDLPACFGRIGSGRFLHSNPRICSCLSLIVVVTIGVARIFDLRGRGGKLQIALVKTKKRKKVFTVRFRTFDWGGGARKLAGDQFWIGGGGGGGQFTTYIAKTKPKKTIKKVLHGLKNCICPKIKVKTKKKGLHRLKSRCKQNVKKKQKN